MRKALLAAVCVSALGLGAPAFAQSAGNIVNEGNITGFNETDDSTNATIDIEDTANNNADNSQNTTVDVNDVGNDNSDNSTNTTIDIDDVGNDNSNTRTSANNHTLTGTVTGAVINFTGGAGSANEGDFVSGNARVDTSGSFAGIQNTSANTGFATNVLVSNALSANADISFAGAD